MFVLLALLQSTYRMQIMLNVSLSYILLRAAWQCPVPRPNHAEQRMERDRGGNQTVQGGSDR